MKIVKELNMMMSFDISGTFHQNYYHISMVYSQEIAQMTMCKKSDCLCYTFNQAVSQSRSLNPD